MLERLGLPASTCTSATAAEHVPADARRGRRSPPRSRASNVELRRRATTRGIPVLHRAAALRALVATRRTIAVAGSHGKTTTSSMLALILRAAGWHPSFVIGGEVNEVGTNAAFGDGRVARRRGRRERRHVPRARAARRRRHQRRARPPRPLRRLRRARARVRAVRRVASPAPWSCAPTTPSRADARARRAAARRHLRLRRRRRLPHRRLRRAAAAARRFTLVPSTATSLGRRRSCRCRASQRGERGRRGRDRARARRRRSTRSRARSAAFGGVARRFQYRGERDGVTFVDDYAHLPSEVGAAIARRPRGRVGARGRRVPAPPLHAHRGALARLRRRVRRRRHARAHRRVPGGRDAASRACRAAWSCARCSTPTPSTPSPTSRAAPTSSRVPRLRPARRPRADPRRRRPHHAARRLAGAATRERSTPLRGDASPRGRRSRAVERDVPVGRLTTYRVGGPVAVLVARRVAGRRSPRSPTVVGASTGRRRSWSSAGARTCSSPTPGSPGSGSCSTATSTRRPRRRPGDARGATPGARGRRSRCSPAGRRRPGRPGSSSSSASRAASAARCA